MIKEVAEVFNNITDEEWAKFINDYFKKVILDNENIDYTKEINTEFKVDRRDNSEYNTYNDVLIQFSSFPYQNCYKYFIKITPFKIQSNNYKFSDKNINTALRVYLSKKIPNYKVALREHIEKTTCIFK